MADQGLTQAINQTLAYSHHFSYPLTLPELHARLIRRKISPNRLALALTSLVKTKVILYKKPYYYLPGKGADLKRRELYTLLSQPLLTYAHSLLPALTKLPTVRAIFVTGSLAVSNSDGHDDIDLLVITDAGKLWSTRLLLTIYTSLLGIRRTRRTRNIMGKLCLNLYLTTGSLAIPESKRSLYTAYELIQAKPLSDPHNLHAQLLHANSWLRAYLPNFPIPKPSNNLVSDLRYPIYEKLAYSLQYLYMKPKITREYITRDAAFFHPHDPSPPTITIHKL